MLINLFK